MIYGKSLDETVFDLVFTVIKWFGLQTILYFLTLYLWNNECGVGTLVLMFIYTMLYAVYRVYVPKEKVFRWLLAPYIVYLFIAILLYIFTDNFISSIWLCTFLPLFGFLCLLFTKLCCKFIGKICKQNKMRGVIAFVVTVFFCLKLVGVQWMCKGNGDMDAEKNDILSRRNYLVEKLVTTPQNVLNEMPASIGAQFQGEWALYSCSMLSASLVNISNLYPETKGENLKHISRLIDIVKSHELQYYDTMRWGESALDNLDGDVSHVSYLSHLAWMICGYKELGGGNEYDELLTALCEAMNRRILHSESLNLPTYPGESIYIPDMLVAIVALQKYSEMNNGRFHSTVRKWVKRAGTDWIDKETGLLVSVIDERGKQYEDAPVKGSYSALNCYYLTFVDEAFARQQYEQLKSLFWKEGLVAGLKEYSNRTPLFAMDIDAGPIMLGLSPSGTAFCAGGATFFNDSDVRKGILKTAEFAGHTIHLGHERHYLLANVALVGEAIMLAMRTHVKR